MIRQPSTTDDAQWKREVTDFLNALLEQGLIVSTPDGSAKHAIKVDNSGAVVTALVDET